MIIKTYHIVTIDITQIIDNTLSLNFSFPILRAFTSTHAKVLVYLSIKTYFSILHTYFSKHPTSYYLFYIAFH